MDTPKLKMRSTSYDVARLAGVSQSAVSRCFKPSASISKKMREKVMKAAKELNYQPNAIARGLITRRSNLISVLVSSQMNFYYPEVLFQLTDRISKQGDKLKRYEGKCSKFKNSFALASGQFGLKISFGGHLRLRKTSLG